MGLENTEQTWVSDSWMDPAVKANWIECLRGKGCYTQCRAELHKPNVGFCCLGVLQNEELAGVPNGMAGALDTKNLESVGLSCNDQEALYCRNDGVRHGAVHHHPHTFPEIADWIEQNVGTR